MNPSAKRKIDKITGPLANVNSFQAVAEEWFDKARREGRAEVTLGKLKWLLEFARPIIGARKIGEIKVPELLAVLRAVEKRGHYETARRLRSTCGQVFRYAIATGRADRDISADLRGAITVPKVTQRAAITSPMEAGVVGAIEQFYTRTCNVLPLMAAQTNQGRTRIPLACGCECRTSDFRP